MKMSDDMQELLAAKDKFNSKLKEDGDRLLSKDFRWFIIIVLFALIFILFRTGFDTGYHASTDAFSAACWAWIFQFIPALRINNKWC